jgi:hypothetical protein
MLKCGHIMAYDDEFKLRQLTAMATSVWEVAGRCGLSVETVAENLAPAAEG